MKSNFKSFQKHIWQFYRAHKRDLPWRPPTLKLRRGKDELDPYKIFVSEVMLQQTQVSRVERKYPEFLKAFPSFKALAKAPLRKVLKVWQGMGYNRRALALHRAAVATVKVHSGRLPKDPAVLETFPGIGPATAASIAAFAWNKPVVFIETNIRRVFIHHFFPRRREVRDEEIIPLLEKSLSRNHSREWYWALMDYGSALAKQTVNPNRRSARHRPQPAFEGSLREMRGKIVRLITAERSLSRAKLDSLLGTGARIEKSLVALVKEGILEENDVNHEKRYFVGKGS